MTQMRFLDKSEDRRYFTIIPNLLWAEELGLSVPDFKLYATIKKVAGEGGECFMSTRTLAKVTRISTGAVSGGKRRLAVAGLIRIVTHPRGHGGQPIDHITIVDIWQRNVEHFVLGKERSPGEHLEESVHGVNTSGVERSPGEHKRSCGETEEEPLNKIPGLKKKEFGKNSSSEVAEELWKRAQEELKLQIVRPTYNTWLNPSRGLAFEGGVFTIEVKSIYAQDWCSARLRGVIERVLRQFIEGKVEAKFVVKSSGQGSNGQGEKGE